MKQIVGILLVFALSLSAQISSSAKKKEPWRDSTGNVHSYQSVGRLAIKEVRWDWRPVGWIIEFGPGRTGYLGMTYGSQKKIVVWIRPEHSPTQVANTLTHELAHAFQFSYFTQKLCEEWLAARKLPENTSWSPPCKGCIDFGFGAGDFAESVKWTLQSPGVIFRSKLGPPPNKEQQALIRKWLTTLPKMAGM